ncbi:MAG: phenylalanine--tRNA ligase subunit beta [Oscillospiraceae bacterium]|nr:phenylalanine--tRNA ligase subunit beta [Oscillospiraceae bacterium]MBQ5896859.1 phenylalanine--tRNA ligase subunit beta [Oscillospiraceae bacterium]
MDLSLRWLADYVETGVTPKQFCDAMTMSGSKVECYNEEADYISNVVVGKILKIEKHPDADKLQICQIDIGREEPIQIVTAAQNVYEGMMVPAALDNSTLAGGIKIKKGKLRGVPSNGMMCSVAELGVTVHDFPYAIEDGIMDIKEDCKPGDDIRTALGINDVCVEFEITSNRPDCLSVLGLAREAAATFGKELHMPEVKIENETGDINELLSVEVKNPTLCRRYVARMIKNIKVGPSPRWMRERLRASGVRPINNLVDITNFVMLEYGQPMHAFDYKYLAGNKIVVRNAEEGESITTLDGVERKLSPEMLCICDAEKPSCVAGVMGGEYSGIQDDTNMVVFESASFLGSSVRTTAKKLGMRTESSGRFEKNLDSRMCMEAVNRACQLVEMLGAGEVIGGYIDIDNEGDEPYTVDFCPEWTNKFLGIDLPAEKMVEILEKIGYKVENGVITVPSFRAGDTRHKADIAEEIARFYGYDVIPNTAVQGASQGALTLRQQFEKKLSRLLMANGCYEAQTYSFISPKYYDKINLPEDSDLRRSVVITNPLGEDTSVMRTTCVPSMLEVIARNYNNRNIAGRFFELGTIYLPKESADILPEERGVAVIGSYGEKEDFFAMKGIILEALDKLGVYGVEFTANKENPTFHRGRCADISIGEKKIGVIGEIAPAVLDNYGIGTRAYVATLDIADIFDARIVEKKFKPTPKFPASTRDLAIICDDELPAASLEKAIRAGAGKLLEKVELFDVYKGSSIAEGKKSVAYTMTLRAADRTLTVEECDKAVNKVLKELANIGAELRS